MPAIPALGTQPRSPASPLCLPPLCPTFCGLRCSPSGFDGGYTWDCGYQPTVFMHLPIHKEVRRSAQRPADPHTDQPILKDICRSGNGKGRKCTTRRDAVFGAARVWGPSRGPNNLRPPAEQPLLPPDASKGGPGGTRNGDAPTAGPVGRMATVKRGPELFRRRTVAQESASSAEPLFSQLGAATRRPCSVPEAVCARDSALLTSNIVPLPVHNRPRLTRAR